MSQAADNLLRAVARSMADGQRVLLVGASFETLELLAAADVRELVVVSEDADPDAPAGETVGGAPLRLRPDFGERPRSKDIVLDPAGVAPPDEVARLLKKHGLYLTAVDAPALAALPHRRVLRAERFGALLLRPGGLDAPFVQTLAGGLRAEDAAEGVEIHIAGHTEALPPPIACLTGAPGVDRAALDAAEAARDAAGARLGALEAELAAAVAATAAESARAAEAEARAAGQTEAHTAAQARLDAALDAGARAEAALAARTAELAELERDYEAVRAELAERRVDDRRFERLSARFEAARAQMSAEVLELRARLREVDAPAAEIEALVAGRDRARGETVRLIARLADTVARLAPDRRMPATPVPADDDAAGAALDAWLEAVEGAVEAVAAELESLRGEQADWIERGGALTARVRELHAAVETLTAEQADRALHPAPMPAPEAGELAARVEALESALAAERALRAAEVAERRRAIAAAREAEASHEALRRRLVDLRRGASAAALGQAAAEDEIRRLGAELRERITRADDLEEMIAAHRRMEDLLTEALQAAEARTEVAEDARRQAEANLRLLRAEYERGRRG